MVHHAANEDAICDTAWGTARVWSTAAGLFDFIISRAHVSCAMAHILSFSLALLQTFSRFLMMRTMPRLCSSSKT